MKIKNICLALTLFLTSGFSQLVDNEAFMGTGKTFADLRDAKLLGGIDGDWLVSRYQAAPTTYDPFKWFPAYEWSFGCTPTSYSMVAAYWGLYYGMDLGHTGIPTNNRVGVWAPNPALDRRLREEFRQTGADPNVGTWEIYDNGNCPISASRQGLAGLTGNGHVEQYWAHYDEQGNPHLNDELYFLIGRIGFLGLQKKDCIADWIGTSRGPGIAANGGTGISVPLRDGGKRKNSSECKNFHKYIKSVSDDIVDVYDQRGDYSDFTVAEAQYALSQLNLLQSDANELHTSVTTNDGMTFEEVKTNIDAGIPVILNTVRTIPKRFWNSSNVNEQRHTVVAIGYWEDGDLYVRSTWEVDEHARLRDYGLASKISSINWTRGDMGTREVRWVIRKAVTFEGDCIQRDQYSRTGHNANEVLPQYPTSSRVQGSSKILDWTDTGSLNVIVAKNTFSSNDSVKFELFAKRMNGDSKAIFSADTLLAQDKSLTYTIPKYDFTEKANEWMYVADDPQYLEGLLVVSKQVIDTIVETDTLFRRQFYRERVLLKHNVPFTAPDIDIKTEVFNIGDTLQGIDFSVINFGGPTVDIRWGFGDGRASFTSTATHVYNRAGTYAVNLLVTGVDGREYSTTKNVVVENGVTSVIDNKISSLFPNVISVKNSILNIKMAQKGEIGIRVYNTLGREVHAVDLGVRSSGLHKIDFNANRDLASGAYLVRITANNKSITTKALIR